MPNLSTNPREPLETLKTYPAFQVLRDKAETHQLQFRPEESKRLKKNLQFEKVLDERAMRAWNVLADARRNGANQHEAEEVALPHILLPSEKDEAQTESQ